MVHADHLLNFYIDGHWVPPARSGALQDVVDPATGEISGRIALGDAADIGKAVAAAARAFPSYATWPLRQRLELLEAVCAEYERRLLDMADVITLEMGAPLRALSRPVQAPVGLWHLQTALQEARRFAFERDEGTTRIVREPIGVCALITPWNWPINQVACKVASALAVGCTIVLKPSQNAPYSSAVFAEILHAAGVPAGVFNLVQGEGARLGEVLAAHPLVDMVSLLSLIHI